MRLFWMSKTSIPQAQAPVPESWVEKVMEMGEAEEAALVSRQKMKLIQSKGWVSPEVKMAKDCQGTRAASLLLRSKRQKFYRWSDQSTSLGSNRPKCSRLPCVSPFPTSAIKHQQYCLESAFSYLIWAFPRDRLSYYIITLYFYKCLTVMCQCRVWFGMKLF